MRPHNQQEHQASHRMRPQNSHILRERGKSLLRLMSSSSSARVSASLWASLGGGLWAMGEAILERCRVLVSKGTVQLQKVGEDGRSLISTASSAATDAVQAASAAAHQVSSTRRPLCMFVCHLSVSIRLMRHAHRVSARPSQTRQKKHRRRRAQGLQQAGQEADSWRHAWQLPGGLDGRRLHRGSGIPLCPRLMLEH